MMTRINGKPASKEKGSKRILDIYLNLNKFSKANIFLYGSPIWI
jgi:hypothetical protein